MPALHHYLLVFDHSKGELIGEEDFGHDSERAVVAYAAKESEYRDFRFVEIVLIGSDSIDTVKITHANYFDHSIADVTSKYLAGI